MRLTPVKSLVMVALATVLAYGNSLNNRFVWDDELLVCENRVIRNCTYVPDIFTSDLFHEDRPDAAYYRPLQLISYMWDYRLWGLNPLGYHLTNVLLHLLGAWLVYLLADQLCRNRSWALITALFFAVHPVNSNAVTYVAGRADLLAFIAMIGSLLLFIRYHRQPSGPFREQMIFRSGAMVSFTVALFSRETALLTPFLILLYCLILAPGEHRVRDALAAVAPFVIVLGFFIAWRTAVLAIRQEPVFAHWHLPYSVRWQIPFRALATYLGILVWPAQLHMDRQVVASNAWTVFLTGAGISATAALLWAMRWTHRHSRLALFGLCWFVITLLPMLGIFGLIASVAEHWLYVPSVGLYLALGTVVFQKLPSAQTVRTARILRAAVGVCVVAITALALRTIRRNEDWANPTTLFAQTRGAAPHSTGARNNLGREYLNSGQWDRALQELLDAERLSPCDPFPKANLSAFYLAKGDLDKALAKNEENLKLDPENAGALLRLAAICDRRGEIDRARHHYRRALAHSSDLYPQMVFAQFLLNHRRFREALTCAREIVETDPGYAEGYNLLGIVLDRAQQRQLAADAFEMARSLDRYSPNGDLNLGRLAWRAGDLAVAADCYRRVLRLRPHDLSARYRLGLTYWRQGEFHSAEREFTCALAVAPGNHQLRTALVKVQRGDRYPPRHPEMTL